MASVGEVFLTARPDTSQFSPELQRYLRSLKASVDVEVKADTRSFRDTVRNLGRNISAVVVKVKAELDAFSLRDVSRALSNKFEELKVLITPELNKPAYRAVMRDLAVLTADRTVTITADADTRGAADDLALLTRARNVRVTAQLDTHGAHAALANLLQHHNLNIGVNAGGGGSPTSPAGGAGGAVAAGGANPLVIAGALAAATALLPALGALVPMIAGVTVATKTMSLGFSGVGDAMKLAGTDAEAYEEALAKMSPAQRAFTKELVAVRDSFKGVGKDIQAAMLPGFTRALQAAKPVISSVQSSMVKLGGSFGGVADEYGKMFKSSGFQKDFSKVLGMGNDSINAITRSFVPFTSALIRFGAASKPTLTAFTKGISGLMGAGLPGFFRGLEKGVAGTASYLDGLFDMLNLVLPALGRFSGSMAKAFGPFLGSLLRSVGVGLSAIMDGLSPIAEALGPTFTTLGRTIENISRASAPLVRTIGAGLGTAIAYVTPLLEGLVTIAGYAWEAFGRLTQSISNGVTKALGGLDPANGPLMRFSEWVKANKGPITGMFDAAGNVALSLLKVMKDLGSVGLEVGKALLSAFMPGSIGNAGSQATGAVNTIKNALQGVSDWINAHRLDIAQVFHIMADGALTVASSIVENMPAAFAMFRMLATVALDAFGMVINGAAAAFGWLPGLGGKIKGAAATFNDFDAMARQGLGAAQGHIDNFSATVGPKLRENKLRMDINLWQSELTRAKAMLNDPAIPAEKKTQLRAEITDLQAKIAAGKSQLASLPSVKMAALRANITDWSAKIANAKTQLSDKNLPAGKRAKLTADIRDWTAKRANAESQLKNMKASKTAMLLGNKSGFDAAKGAVDRAKLSPKTGIIRGNASSFWGTIASIGSAFIPTKSVNIVANVIGAGKKLLGFAKGGIIPGYASGGILPGYTPGRDIYRAIGPSGPIALGGGESIMRPEWTRAVGPDYVKAMNLAARQGGIKAVRSLIPEQRFASGGIVDAARRRGSELSTLGTSSAVYTSGSSMAKAIGDSANGPLVGTIIQNLPEGADANQYAYEMEFALRKTRMMGVGV